MDQITHRLGSGTGTVHCQPHLHQQGEVVRWYVRMRTTNNLALLEPLLTDGAQDTQWLHGGLGVEDVVNNSFELECVVCIGHQL